ncbi:MAG TPA: cytochrome c [Mucilaginibacter sp.]
MRKYLLVFSSLLSLTILITISSCQNDKQIEFNRYFSAGSAVYQNHCQNCHGAKGEGLKGLIPPLTDSAWLKTNKATLACSVKNGLKGNITISNKQYGGEMPATDLSPLEVAQVITYVTNSFGNKIETTTTEDVDAALLKCR